MTIIRIAVDDAGAVADAMDDIDFQHIAEYAMRDALINSGYLDEVWRRVPKSDRNRYAEAAGAKLKIDKRGGDNDPGSWKASLERGWRSQLSEKTLKRVDDYGMERLALSLIPAGDPGQVFSVSRDNGSVSLSISSDIPYAARMHEAEKPAEGNYWTPGKDSGWSASGTGSKFLERPYEALADTIAEELMSSMEARMREAGLI